jgi:hypothetical protein
MHYEKILFFQWFTNPPSLEQIQARGIELVDEINALLNFERNWAPANDPTNISVLPRLKGHVQFSIWLLHVKSFVYFLLGAVNQRTFSAYIRYCADRRLRLFQMQISQREVTAAAVRCCGSIM